MAQHDAEDGDDMTLLCESCDAPLTTEDGGDRICVSCWAEIDRRAKEDRLEELNGGPL